MNLFLSLIISLSISVPRSGSPKIHLLPVGASNVYLLQGSKNILIDTGTPKGVDKIEKGLEKLGLSAAELDLIVLTHGHGDHGGGTAFLQEKYEIPVLAGKGDAEMMASGENGEFQVQSFLGWMLKDAVDYGFPPYEADHWLALGERWSLEPYGIDGEVVSLPGHTPGSLAVKLTEGQVFVGDLLRGGMVANKQAKLHFFHESRAKVDQQIKSLLEEGFTTFYLGHWGPLTAEEIERDYPWEE